jgi:type IV pilus assembly protein PilE
MKVKGFTLIELMVAVAILAIVAAIAIPAYNNQVEKARRADAQSALLSASQALERCFTRTNTYIGCDIASESPDGFYNISFSQGPAASSYELQAEPKPTGPQANDACGIYTLDHRGNRDAGGAASDRCWGT